LHSIRIVFSSMSEAFILSFEFSVCSSSMFQPVLSRNPLCVLRFVKTL
jgi:hypothetical protein